MLLFRQGCLIDLRHTSATAIVLTQGKGKSNHRAMWSSDSNPNKAPDRDSLRNLNLELEKHFPRPTEESELVLLEVSPHKLHAYWHITPWDLETVSAEFRVKKPRLILRFHDLTSPPTKQQAAPSFDIEIDATSGSRYVELWEAAKSYVAELGFRLEDGRLIDLARSNRVELPKAGTSARHGTQVLTLTPEADSLFAPFSESLAEPESERQARSDAWQADTDLYNDATLQKSIKRLFPLFPDPNAPVFDARSISADLHSASEKPAKQPVQEDKTAQSQTIPTSEPGLSQIERAVDINHDRTDDFPLCSIADAFALARDNLIPVIPLDSLYAAARWIPKGFAFPTALGRKQAGPLAPAGIPAGRIETAREDTGVSSSAVSSFSLLQNDAEEVHMELRIFGRARPNAHYLFHGQPIDTDADGRFSLRKELGADKERLVAQLLANDPHREQ